MAKRLILLALCILPCIMMHSQVILQEDTVKCSIYFHQGKSNFDPRYKENDKRLKQFVNEVYFRDGDPAMSIKRIRVSSGASPEGSESINTRLSNARAAAIISYLKEHTTLNDSSIIVRSPGVDWETLAVLVELSDHVPDKDTVLTIIRSKEFGNDNIARRKALETLKGGAAYRWMYRNLFPLVRHSSVSIAYVSRHWKEIASLYKPALQECGPLPCEDQGDIVWRPYGPAPKKEIFYLRTNFLSPVSNFGVEYCINHNWSIGADYYFPWVFRNPNHKNCFQVLGGSIEGRYWFGKERGEQDRLEGHSLGFGLMGGYYDMERNYTGKQGEFGGIGVDYLYSLPIANDKLHMEFSLGLGYIYSYVKPYNVFEDGGKAYKTGYTERFHWVGPTKATVSLVVPIKAKRRTGK